MTENAQPLSKRDELYKEFWAELSRRGDPDRIPNKVRTGFNAGWDAARMNPIISKGQVVFDVEQWEYVTFLSWSEERSRAKVFNPRCGEKYEKEIRALNQKEIGN